MSDCKNCGGWIIREGDKWVHTHVDGTLNKKALVDVASGCSKPEPTNEFLIGYETGRLEVLARLIEFEKILDKEFRVNA